MVRRARDIPVVESPSNRSRTAVRVQRLDVDAAHESADPNHHLWRNGRLWWIAFTVHRGHLQERLRFSLRTADEAVARRRRDAVFALYASKADCRISIRLQPRRRPRTRGATEARF